MDNLENILVSSVKVRERPREVEEFCYSNGIIAYVSDDQLFIYEEGRGQETFESHTIEGIEDKLKHVTYMAADKMFCLATSTQLVLFNRITGQAVVHHMLDRPILAIAWNPTQTVLAMIAVQYEISILTLDRASFHVIHSNRLTADVPARIQVGWGSQHSQFQGPNKQKRLRDIGTETVEKLAVNDPPKISWRGNGEQLVVNFFKDGNRYLKLFTSDLTAQFQSEDYLNLEAPVSFRGQGQTIASCAVRENYNDLIIFEKNCNVKAVFPMKETLGRVKKLLYHPEMNLLAILSIDNERCSYLNVYIFFNGHWYLKQQLFYHQEHSVLDFQWIYLHEPPFTTCKIVVFTTENVECHLFRFILNRSNVKASVGVIDGKTLNIYKFDEATVPSPMPVNIFENSQPINNVVFHPTGPECMISDSRCCAKLLSFEGDTVIEVDHSRIDINKIKRILSVDNVSIELTEGAIQVQQQIEFDPEPKVKLPYNETKTLIPFKVLDQHTSNLIYVTQTISSGIKFEVALASNRDLYLNDMVICEGVTSFKLYTKYCLFTHENSNLYCMRLQDFHLFSDKLVLSKLFAREVEQGTRIVQINNMLPPQMILQIPRGNFETINCKLITIDLIEELLQENKWEEVFIILRNEKINWNVLIDLNPERFINKIEDFVKATKYRSILKMIITEFSVDENCFETIYKNFLPFATTKYDKKVVILKILEFLLSTDCVNNLGAIVALQQKHISLKTALKSIKDIYQENHVKNEAVCIIVLRELLNTETFTSVIEVAYDLFCLEFLGFIFCNGSMEDPRVYEPELEALRRLPPMEQKFQMCVKGKNYISALKYLLRCDKFKEEFISKYIKEHKLEKYAYYTTKREHIYFKLLSNLYATRLAIEQRYVESGLILKRAGLLVDALKYYKKALEWREVVALLNVLNVDEYQKRSELYEMADLLLKVRRAEEAVFIYECYLKDYKKAIRALVDNKQFRTAISVALTYNVMEDLDNLIMPNLKDYMISLKEKLDEFRNKFEEYVGRLRLIRESRAARIQLSASELKETTQDDIFSEIQSTTSLGSSKGTLRSHKTTMSAKNRRKEAKKKINLRPGGFYEDIALMRALHVMYTDVFNFGKDIYDVCLIQEHEDWEFCKIVSSYYSDLKSDMFKKIEDIWPDTFLNPVSDSSDFVTLAVIQNKGDLDSKYSNPPTDFLLNPWSLNIF